ncbi:AbrB/MazE/SpoVT family DNA-binding domain-containing protein [Methylobacterium nodulans]|uniref:Addiction module antidote n=1 Tax=Methylobacterium nodulans (strain LMG 21967 / CNCM I-2342 / ORS 2060) TaxID=460265 RepID=B8IVP1_METNO|nr:AbrB/MazE/SpoVT family DNA-binding domain-containing protein [Methylobacterium nodulans]ACL62481.1 addiction module antidote [Methylobacterium nodulans ORS 2060]
MLALKLTAIGNSVGVILPKEALSRLKLDKGDTVYLTETPDGYRITPYNEEFETQMKAAREIMRQNRDVLRELAK